MKFTEKGAMSMTIKDLLDEYLDQERDSVFHYASNYRMDQPKKGYEREFRAAQERVELLEELIETVK